MRELTEVRVAVFEPSSLLRDGMVSLIGTGEGMRVVADAAEGSAHLIDRHDAHVVLIDGDADAEHTNVLIGEITRSRTETVVIVLSSSADFADVAGHVAAGASGCVSKTVGAPEFLNAIRVAADRDSDNVAIAMPRDVVTGTLDVVSTALDAQDEAMLDHLRHARSNREIARALSVSEATVKRHLTALYRKLGARSRLDAMRLTADDPIAP